MFNGIIETLGRVEAIRISGGKEFTLSASFCKELSIGESIAVNGVCTTVVSKDDSSFRVFASQETLAITNLSALQPGDAVNLERSLVYGSRISGHIVYGHVDKTVPLLTIDKKTDSWLFTLRLDHEDHGWVIPKGSIALNGISLTVYDLKPDRLTVMIIPHTFTHTNLSSLKPGDAVNCEFDSLGKFIQRHVEFYLSNHGEKGNPNESFFTTS